MLTLDEKVTEALSELRQLANEFRSQAERVCYGYFIGGDPRKFSPDPECSTEKEREAHRAACAAWDRGEEVAIPGPHEALRNESGEAVGWVTVSGFGMGVSAVEDEEARDAAERLERILDRLERGLLEE